MSKVLLSAFIFSANIFFPINSVIAQESNKDRKKSEKFEISGGIGYGFSFNGNMLQQNRTLADNYRTFDGVYGSWAEGESFFIKIDYNLSNCFDAGVEFDYTHGKKYSWDQIIVGSNSTNYQHYESRYTGYSATPFIQFNPCGINNRLTPYVDLGIRLNFSNAVNTAVNEAQVTSNNATTIIQEITYKGEFTTGFDAGLGIRYKLGNNWSVIAEIRSSNSNFIPDDATLNKYTVNGTDQIGTLNTSQRKIDYVKSFTVSTPDPNSPSMAQQVQQSASTIGLRFGVGLKF